jgi:hypothetical protein
MCSCFLLALHCTCASVLQALQYRGIPFYVKPYGILNVTGINEGVVQGSNFRPDGGREPIQFESSLMRTVKTVSTGKQAAGGCGTVECLTRHRKGNL